jgi:hypothetical protein
MTNGDGQTMNNKPQTIKQFNYSTTQQQQTTNYITTELQLNCN